MNPQFKSWIIENLEAKDWLHRSEDERMTMFKTAVAKGYTGSFESFSRKIRRVKNELNGVTVPPPDQNFNAQGSVNFEVEGNEGVATSEASSSIRTIDDLLKSAKVDMDVWNLVSQKVNTWEAQSSGGGIVSLYQVKGYLVKKVPDVQRVPVIKPIQLSVPKFNKPTPSNNPVKKYLILADTQIGYRKDIHTGELTTEFHDMKAMNACLDLLRNQQFDEIILNGDLLDMTEASKYTQLPTFAFTLQPAINCLGEWLANIRTLAPNSKITYLIGNHEVRLKNSLIENLKFAYDLKAYKDDVPIYSLRKLLDLDTIGIDLIEDYPKGSYWISDNIRVIHGEFTNASKELSTSNTSVIFGHLHRMETQSKSVHHRDGIRQVQVVVSGCLCKITGEVPGVNTRPSWQQGIVSVEVANGVESINHIPIVDGKLIYQGKVYGC